MARRGASGAADPEGGAVSTGPTTGCGGTAGGAIGDTTSPRGASSRTISFAAAPGAADGAGLARDARTDGTAWLAGAGVPIASRGSVPGATGRREGGTSARSATGGGGSAGEGIATVTSGVGTSPSLTVPVGAGAAVALGRTARAGRLRAWPTAGSLSTRGLASRGQGMKPKWPAAANTAPQTSSRPKAASAVDQRKPAARRWLARRSARRRCLIRSRSVTVSSSNGSAARTKDTSGPSWRFFADSVVSLSILMECFLAFSRQIIEKPSPCTMDPDPDGVGLDFKQGRDFCR